MNHGSSIPRRRFLGALAIAGATLSLPGSEALAEAPAHLLTPFDGPGDWDNSWLDKLKAKHRPFFENKSMGGDTLQYPKRYFDAMVDGYGADPKDINVIIGFSGSGWPIALNDEKWATWSLSANPNGGNAPGKNPMRGDAADDAVTGASVMAWKKRGAIFLVCNNALKKGAADLATKTSGDAAKIYTEMRASIIPEFIVVPALVAALALAQENKCPYMVGS